MNFVFKYSKFSLFRRQNDAFSEAVKSSNKKTRQYNAKRDKVAAMRGRVRKIPK